MGSMRNKMVEQRDQLNRAICMAHQTFLVSMTMLQTIAYERRGKLPHDLKKQSLYAYWKQLEKEAAVLNARLSFEVIYSQEKWERQA